MRSFWEVFGFEMRLQGRSPMFAGLILAFFAIHLLTASQIGIHVSDNQLIAYNSPYLVFRTELVLGVFGMAPAIFFVVNAAARDWSLATAEFFHATPVPKLSFLLGRFAGGTACALLVGLAGVVGAASAVFMPWLDPGRIASFTLQPYVLVFALLVAPNLVVFSALAFSVAALSRGPILSFALALAFVALAVALNTAAIRAGPDWLALLDPFGSLPVERLVRYWSVDQLNTALPTDLLPANRLLWLGLAGLVLTGALPMLRLEHAAERGGGRGLRRRAATPAPPPEEWRASPGRFGPRSVAAQLGSQWRVDLRAALLNPLFWLVVALTVASALNQIHSNVSALMDLPLHPATSQMLTFLRYDLIQFVLVVIIFFSGVVMHREREHGLHEIVGASPYPDWLPLVSKILTLFAVLTLVMLAEVLTCVAWQAVAGDVAFEPLVYLRGVFLYSGFHLCMLAILACVLQTLAPGKWSGMLLAAIALIGFAALPVMGFEHLLYGFRIPFVVYTDMDGFGHQGPLTWSLMVYWGAFCVLLILAGCRLYPRGAEVGLGARVRRAGRRPSRGERVLALAAVGVFALAGGWIFYNTNIVNTYETTASRLEKRADYERRYAAFKEAPYPSVTAIDLTVDLYPRERRLQTRGRAELRNNNAAPMSQVFLSADPRLALGAIAVEGGRLTRADPRQGVFIFTFPRPLAPGAKTAMTWSATRLERGFVNSEPDTRVVGNGTFIPLAEAMPRVAYDIERELTDGAQRKRHRLPPAAGLPALGDPTWIGKLGYGADSLSDCKVVFSTDADQTAVAPGVLRRQWREGRRRYFEYEMPMRTRPVVMLSSARYQIARDRWNGVDIEVYHDAKHPWNVRAMLDTSKTALDYFSREFAPYPLPFFRIVEFPGYRDQAQAYAGAIAYSETVGFLNDLSGFGPLDYTTIHELAHQWWGGMAYGARMQGRQVLNEGLAQYSTFMLFKQLPDPQPLRRILAQTNRAYLAARSEERVAEQPVLLSEDQGYISYNKAPLALFALQDLIGEEKVNQALRSYLRRFAMKPAPYPTTRDLVDELRAVAGPERQDLITDLFEKITFYDVQTTAVSARRVGSGYEVVMDVAARQFEADGRGKEREVPLDAWFQVVVFPKSDRDLPALKPLYQAHHRLHGGKQRLVIRVPSAPGAAGVDPFHLMIDRTPDDNTLKLGT